MMAGDAALTLALDDLDRDELIQLFKEGLLFGLRPSDLWGADAWDPHRVDHVLEEIRSGEPPWPDLHCFGLSKDGRPIHPMAWGRSRIPDHAQLVFRKAGSPSATPS